MKWEYKIVSTDALLQKPIDHDIAVSKQAVENIRENSKNSLQNTLSKLGNDGWEFVTLLGEFGVFKKQTN
ncbi:MAG: hypothetical protein ACRENO_00950 [Thermodesulfobacteriota bacterium]